MSAEADRGHRPQPSVLSQPVGWGWKLKGSAGCALEPTLAIWGSSRKAQRRISVAGFVQVVRAISTSIMYLTPATICNKTSRQRQLYSQHTEKGSLPREVFLLHDGKQTPKVQRELDVVTSTKEAFGTPSETGNKIQVNKSLKAASLAINRDVLTHEQRREATGSFHSAQLSRSSD